VQGVQKYHCPFTVTVGSVLKSNESGTSRDFGCILSMQSFLGVDGKSHSRKNILSQTIRYVQAMIQKDQGIPPGHIPMQIGISSISCINSRLQTMIGDYDPIYGDLLRLLTQMTFKSFAIRDLIQPRMVRRNEMYSVWNWEPPVFGDLRGFSALSADSTRIIEYRNKGI
jgi:hypothetical protein